MPGFKRLLSNSIIWPIVLTLPVAGCAGPAAMTFLSMAGPPLLELAGMLVAGDGDEAAGPEQNVDIIAIADSLKAKGDVKNAAQMYSRAHLANPSDPAPLIGLGESLLDGGANEPASQAFARALLLEPANDRALRGMGKAHLKLRQPDLAASRFDTLLASRPNDTQGLNGLGIAYDMLGDHARAQEIYRRGLSINPNSSEMRNNLGLSLALGGQSDAAIAELQQLAGTPSATATNRQNLALAYGVAGRLAESEKMASTDLNAADVQSNLRYYAAGAQIAGSAVSIHTALDTSGVQQIAQDAADTPRARPDMASSSASLPSITDSDERHLRPSRTHASSNPFESSQESEIPVAPVAVAAAPALAPVPAPAAMPAPEAPAPTFVASLPDGRIPDAEAAMVPDASPATPVFSAPLVSAETSGTILESDDTEAQLLAAIEPAAGSSLDDTAESSPSGALPEIAPAKPAATGRDATHIYRAQIGSYYSDAAAMKGWRKITRKHDDLSEWQPLVAVAGEEHNGRIYYRLRIGEFASRAEARALCEGLDTRNIDCLVIKSRLRQG